MASTMATNLFERFFDLPPELREQILENVCLFPGGIHVGAYTPGGDDDDDDDIASPGAPPLGLFLASSQLYREAVGLYYGRNTFYWNLKPRRLSRLHPSLADAERGLLTSAAASGARRSIRSLVIYVRLLGSLLEDKIIPQLSDMILAGNLRRLDVRLGESYEAFWDGKRWVEHCHPQRASSLNPDREWFNAMDYAFRALLRLISDPDLERVHVRVARRFHVAFWCAFHAHKDGAPPCVNQRPADHQDGRVPVLVRRLAAMGLGSALSHQTPRYASSTDDYGAFWIDIDLDSLLREHGGGAAELNIKKVTAEAC
ncbi:hypothetical protein B0H63DRAFT_458826 [Podospora didyma]|uniref:Uncharacterized protein n=1 Tax=Podospora didyma TaxID=330526 RepID=A0AAE0P5I1_9PEZI|nr:hypothetical protein B0H63DRAFT_458826 [Podospora didyma]